MCVCEKSLPTFHRKGGFSLGTSVSSTVNVDRLGLNNSQANPSPVAMLRDQTWVIRWLQEHP